MVYYSRLFFDWGGVIVFINRLKVTSEISKKTNLPIHYPKIGAGLGGGDWNTINNIICEELKDHEHNLWVL